MFTCMKTWKLNKDDVGRKEWNQWKTEKAREKTRAKNVQSTLYTIYRSTTFSDLLGEVETDSISYALVTFLIDMTRCITRSNSWRKGVFCSWFEDAIHHSGKGTVARASLMWGSRSCGLHSPEAKKDECWHSAHFLFPLHSALDISPWDGTIHMHGEAPLS